jgi:hypothetical protein
MKHTLKIYKDTPLHAEYMKARFPTGQSHPRSFELEGHRWAYEATSFDDVGDFDRLYRFTDDDIEIPDNTDLRDSFAAAALIGLASNRSMIDVMGGESITYVAEGAWKLADAMLRARGQ